MVSLKNMEEYRALQRKRIAGLKKIPRRTPISACKFMAAQLRSMCPVGTGRMIRSIKITKNSVSIGGSNPQYTRFPYIHWVNNTPGMNMGRVRLGGGDKTYSYAQVRNRRGTPGFFWIAERRTAKYFRDANLSALGKTLRGEY